MTTVKLYCTGAMARATVDGPITHGMVGVQVKIQWDEAWDALVKTLKVRCAEVCRTAVVSEDGTAMIPYECLIAGQWLAIGMDGWDADGTLRIPSSWASCGVVKPSVAQCDGPEGAPPTVDTVAQLQILVDRAESAAGELSGAAAAAASSASDADKSAKAAQVALNKTTEIAVSTPYIGANGNWIVWDAEHDSYVDSGFRAVGVDGSDANVTADNINKALGFTPADSESVNQIKDDLSDKLPKSPSNWEPWTADEQAAAREVMGISEEFERVFLLAEIWEDDTRLIVDVNNLSHFRIFMSLDGGVTSRVADYGLISCTDSNGNKTDNCFELGNITEAILAYDQVAYCKYDINDIPTMARWGQAGGNPAFALRGGLVRGYSIDRPIPNFLVSKIHFPPIKGRVKISIWGC